MFGVTEWIIIALILILLFGASRIPAIGSGMGGAIRNLIDGIKDDPKPKQPSGEIEGK
jgi:sec-independent protein translocase protein TatA